MSQEVNHPIIRITLEHRTCNCCNAQNYESEYPSPTYRRVDTIYEVVFGRMVNAVCPDCLRLLASDALTLLGDTQQVPVKSETECEQEAAITEIAIQFARFWGERELNFSGSLKGDWMKSLDRDELSALMHNWAKEYAELKGKDERIAKKPFVYMKPFVDSHIRELLVAYAKDQMEE